MSQAIKKDKKYIVAISRNGGALVVKCGLKAMRIYQRDEIAAMFLPIYPKDGETLTFEIIKVEKNA